MRTICTVPYVLLDHMFLVPYTARGVVCWADKYECRAASVLR